MDRIDKLQELLSFSPSDCFLLHALGLEYCKIGDFERGLQFFEKVISTNEDYVGTYYHLAKTLERMKRLDESIAIYQKGIAIAVKLKDKHAGNELQMALDELVD